MIENFCQEEMIVGNTTVYCLREIGHIGDCIFADPKVIKLCADKNDEVMQ